MEQRNDIPLILEMMNGPAFTVGDGIIRHCNREAQQRMICPGTPIKELITAGAEEYAAMENGCMYLNLALDQKNFGASVSRLSDCDLFVVDSDQQSPEIAALGLASRELRAPLSDLMMLSSLLLPKLGPEDREKAAAMNRSIHRLLRIMNNMSNVRQFESSTRHPMAEMQVGSLLNELVIQELAPLLAHTGIHLEFEDLSQGIRCLVDEFKLKQAVYALISNAAAFTPKGGLIRVTLKRTENRLQIIVADNGSGISDEVLSNVFHRFRRGEEAEDNRHGIGLGLLLVRAVAAIHNGAVMIERPAAGGTRVILTIPIRRNQDPGLASGFATMVVPSTSDGLVNLSEILPNELYAPNKP